MRKGLLFLTVAMLFVVGALWYGGTWWAGVWPAVSFGWIGAAYLGAGPSVFGKLQDGVLPAGRLYIHCAQGHGKTGLLAAALLLRRGIAEDAADAVARGRSGRACGSTASSGAVWRRMRRCCVPAWPDEARICHRAIDHPAAVARESASPAGQAGRGRGGFCSANVANESRSPARRAGRGLC
jgi:hypothetical protein